MWFVVVILTAILWVLLDNSLIAAILAVFSVYTYTLVRALYLMKKNPRDKQRRSSVTHDEANEVAPDGADTLCVDFKQDNKQ